MKKLDVATLLVLVFLTFTSCKNENKETFEQYEPKEFIDEFFNLNSETIFVDEIERVKIDYFKEANFLVYTFKNRNKLDEDGRLYLQLFAKDTSYLPADRKKYGSINLSINKNEVFEFLPTRNFLIKKLQFPYDIKSISTGNIVNSKKTWKINYSDPDNLINTNLNSEKISNSLDLMFKKIKLTNSRAFLGNLGVKIYSDSKKKIEVYYSSNNQTLITYFGDIKNAISNSEYNIKVGFKDSTSFVTKKIDLTKIKRDNKMGLHMVRFNDFSNIKSISVGQKDWEKTTDIFKLIHHTHVKNIKPSNYNQASDDQKIKELTNYFLSNELKTLYSDNKKLDIYANGQRRSFYIKRTAENNTKEIFVRIYSNDKEYTKGNSYKEISLKNRKRLILSDDKKQIRSELFHVRLPYNIYKIEFGYLENSKFKVFYNFEK